MLQNNINSTGNTVPVTGAAGVLQKDYDFEAHKELVPMQPGDVHLTYADTSALEEDLGFKPSTPLRMGLRAFAEWYAKYYNID